MQVWAGSADGAREVADGDAVPAGRAAPLPGPSGRPCRLWLLSVDARGRGLAPLPRPGRRAGPGDRERRRFPAAWRSTARPGRSGSSRCAAEDARPARRGRAVDPRQPSPAARRPPPRAGPRRACRPGPRRPRCSSRRSLEPAGRHRGAAPRRRARPARGRAPRPASPSWWGTTPGRPGGRGSTSPRRTPSASAPRCSSSATSPTTGSCVLQGRSAAALPRGASPPPRPASRPPAAPASGRSSSSTSPATPASVGLELGNDTLLLRRAARAHGGAPGRRPVVVVDACESGGLTQVKGARPVPAIDFALPIDESARGTAFIASTAVGEAAQESAALGGSFFTHHLEVALRGAADADGDGQVTLAEAFRYTSARTVAQTAGTQTGVQHPTYEFRMSGRGDVVLADLRKAESRLVFPADPGSTYFLRGPQGVLAEVPAQATPLSLALPAGRYAVERRSPDGRATGEVVLEKGATQQLPLLSPTRYEVARAKGGPKPNLAFAEGGIAWFDLKGLGVAPSVRAGVRKEFGPVGLRVAFDWAGKNVSGGAIDYQFQYFGGSVALLWPAHRERLLPRDRPAAHRRIRRPEPARPAPASRRGSSAPARRSWPRFPVGPLRLGLDASAAAQLYKLNDTDGRPARRLGRAAPALRVLGCETPRPRSSPSSPPLGARDPGLHEDARRRGRGEPRPGHLLLHCTRGRQPGVQSRRRLRLRLPGRPAQVRRRLRDLRRRPRTPAPACVQGACGFSCNAPARLCAGRGGRRRLLPGGERPLLRDRPASPAPARPPAHGRGICQPGPALGAGTCAIACDAGQPRLRRLLLRRRRRRPLRSLLPRLHRSAQRLPALRGRRLRLRLQPGVDALRRRLLPGRRGGRRRRVRVRPARRRPGPLLGRQRPRPARRRLDHLPAGAGGRDGPSRPPRPGRSRSRPGGPTPVPSSPRAGRSGAGATTPRVNWVRRRRPVLHRARPGPRGLRGGRAGLRVGAAPLAAGGGVAGTPPAPVRPHLRGRLGRAGLLGRQRIRAAGRREHRAEQQPACGLRRRRRIGAGGRRAAHLRGRAGRARLLGRQRIGAAGRREHRAEQPAAHRLRAPDGGLPRGGPGLLLRHRRHAARSSSAGGTTARGR